MTIPDVAVVMGTYNRRKMLEACVASIRKSVGSLSYAVLVADGGSTDGTREWLLQQSDCELLEGGLEGAVKAFNVGFARAVDLLSPFICQFNDDLTFAVDLALEQAVAKMRTDKRMGALAFASDRYTPGQPTFTNMTYHGVNYANQGLFRREAGMAAARYLGDPEGKKWWCTSFHTYASDTVLGLLLWRLGWYIHEAPELWVHDGFTSDNGHLDPLRLKNAALYTNSDFFYRCFGDPASIRYNREDAIRCGGLVQ